MNKAFIDNFATEWIDAWNKHDLDRILSHYTDDFRMSSPAIATIGNEPSGVFRGKKAVSAYWSKALHLNPSLRFELVTALAGVGSITLFYKGVRGLSAEVLHFNNNGKVKRAHAYYS